MSADPTEAPGQEAKLETKPAWRRWLGHAGTALVVGLILGTLAPFANTVHPLIDLLGQFLIQVCVATIVCFAVAAFRRRPVAALVLGIAFVAQMAQLYPHMGSPGPAPGGAKATPVAGIPTAAGLKVIHFNLFVRNTDAASVLAFLAREDADIVALVEVTPAWRQALAPLRARYPYRMDCWQRRCDVALYAKLPWRQARSGLGQPDGFPIQEATFDLADGPLTLFGVHLARPFYGPLGAQFEQAKRLAARIAATDGHKLLVGDLNAVPWGAVLGEIEDRTGLVRLGALDGTWPSILPWPLQITIDHALADPSLAPGAVRIGPYLGSDHLPVIVQLKVKEPPRQH